MTKPRPGVAAAIRLAANNDADLWKRVEQQFTCIRSEALEEAEKSLLASLGDDDFEELSKNQLLDIVMWKFAVGKPRPQNLGLLRSNTEESVKQCSRKAIQLAKDIDMQASVSKTGEWTTHGKSAIQNAVNEMTKLKGVGPATATAVLCRVRPDIFCYLYDEVIDCFERKRDYTLNVYLRVNSRCLQLAKTLGEEEWTTARIATALWIAARVLANKKDDDLTVSLARETLKPSKLQEKEDEGDAKQSSRKRRRTNNR